MDTNGTEHGNGNPRHDSYGLGLDLTPQQGGTVVDGLALNQEQFREYMRAQDEYVTNAVTLRREMMAKMFDPRRNLENECGLPHLQEYIPPEKYQLLYDRDPIANRVVSCLPKETWQVQPLVYETEDPDDVTDFEEAWDKLGQDLIGNGYAKEEAGSIIWSYLLRADIRSRIGRYGIILFGFDDVTSLDVMATPVAGLEEFNSMPKGVNEVDLGERNRKVLGNYSFTANKAQQEEDKKEGKGLKLLYLRIFSEAQAQITGWESNPTSPRYGQPTEYQVNIGNQVSTGSAPSNTTGMPGTTVKVHWTRVIHIPGEVDDNEWMGKPALNACLEPVLDARKVRGPSAEMFYKGGFPGYSFEKGAGTPALKPINETKFRNMIERWANGLDRYLTLDNLTAKSLAPQVADPTPVHTLLIETICIQIGVPKRVFMGSERGELASTQDDAAWNDRLKARQKYHATPRIIRPFIDRLIMVGVLPAPEGTEEDVKDDKDIGETTENAFCATGSGGGIDPSCSGGTGGGHSITEEKGFHVVAKGTMHEKSFASSKRDKAEAYLKSLNKGQKGKANKPAAAVSSGHHEGAAGHVVDTLKGLPAKYYGNPSIKSLYDGAKAKHPELTLDHFKATLQHMNKAKHIALEEHTRVEGRDNVHSFKEHVPTGTGLGLDLHYQYVRRGSKFPGGQVLNVGNAFPPPAAPPQAGPPGADPNAPPGAAGMMPPPEPEVGTTLPDLPDDPYEDEAPGYYVYWPDLTSQTKTEKADYASKLTTALGLYVEGGLDQIISLADYLTRVWDFPEEEAHAIIAGAQEIQEKKAEEEEVARQDQMEQQQAMADEQQAQMDDAWDMGGIPGEGEVPAEGTPEEPTDEG